jgi:hypothetical protein
VGVDRQPGQPEGDTAHTLAGLAADAGSVTRSSSAVGTSPSNRSSSRLRHRDQVARLALVEPGRPDDLLQLDRVRAGQGDRIGIPGEQRRGHHVDAGVGGLRRQHRGRQQLERVAVVQLAHASG